MVNIDIISGYLKITDHESDTMYGVFDLTNYDSNRVYRVQKIIQQNIERVTISTNPFNKTIELYVGNQIIIQKKFSFDSNGTKNEIVDLFI
jgi:hypothetical protein